MKTRRLIKAERRKMAEMILIVEVTSPTKGSRLIEEVASQPTMATSPTQAVSYSVKSLNIENSLVAVMNSLKSPTSPLVTATKTLVAATNTLAAAMNKLAAATNRLVAESNKPVAATNWMTIRTSWRRMPLATCLKNCRHRLQECEAGRILH